MGIRRIVIFVTVLLAGCWNQVQGQTIRTIDGAKYQEHAVEAGETLFAISRHYAVPVDALQRANPAVASGLSIGQVVLVPLDAVVRKEAKKAPVLKDGELTHTVAKKETLFGIAKKYGVDINDLMESNAALAAGLHEGDVLIIPVQKVQQVSNAVLEPASNNDAPMHEVQQGETLFSLAQRYETTPEAIRIANGGLAEGLKAGRFLRIPLPEEPEQVNAIAADTLDKRASYNIALLLPFALDRNDSLQLADPTGRRLYELTSIATQFHAGATMALDSLAKLGLTAKVHVHDVGASAEVWAPVLRDPEVRDMHLYLGPFHRSAIEQLSAISKNGHIVCPVPQSNRVVLGNARVSKVIGGRTEQVYQVARYVAGRYAKENVLLVLPSSTDESELQGQMRRVLREAINVRPDRLRDSVPEIRIGKKDIAELNAKLDKNRVNILVVPTESVEFVTSFVTRTVPLVEKYRIKVFGLQAWDAMANLEVADLNKLNVHLPLSTFVDRSDSRVIAFTREFRKRTNSDPGDYAFLGFDCTMFYGKALLEQGLDLASAFTRVHTRPLHMEFHMRRMGDENGFVNDSARIIEYKDLERHLAP